MQWFLAALPTLGHHEGALGLCSGSPATLLIPNPKGSCLPGATSAATPGVCFGARTSIKITPTLAAAVMSPAQPQTPQIHLCLCRPQLYTASTSLLPHVFWQVMVEAAVGMSSPP